MALGRALDAGSSANDACDASEFCLLEGGRRLMVNAKQLQSLVSGFSIETTPATAARVDSFNALLPAGTKVNVTFLPGTSYLDTVATAARLRNEGMVPVPHIAARSIAACRNTEGSMEEFMACARRGA